MAASGSRTVVPNFNNVLDYYVADRLKRQIEPILQDKEPLLANVRSAFLHASLYTLQEISDIVKVDGNEKLLSRNWKILAQYTV